MRELALKDVAVKFGNYAALKPMSLKLNSGFVGLIGANGAGKTTCMRAIAGLVAHQGQIEFDGQNLDNFSRRKRAQNIAYLPQANAVHWPLKTRELVALGRLPHRTPFNGLSPRDEAAIDKAMQRADIGDFEVRNVNTLSQGEKARVLIARALAVEAPLFLADEPIAALDPYHQLHIMEVLHEEASRGRLVMAVMHDLTLAARFCDTLLLLHEGELIAQGCADDVLSEGNLARAFRMRALRGENAGTPYLLPHSRLS